VAALGATVEADQAAIEMAQLQLEFSTITAPLSGRTGLRLVDPGTIVHASDANGLVTITQMQPIAVLFTVSQDELPDVLAAMAQGDPAVVAYSRGGERPLATGKLIFADSQVDQGTGHVKLKALFDNSDRALWPGEFVDARVQVATVNAATVVPAKAVERLSHQARRYSRGLPCDRPAGHRRHRNHCRWSGTGRPDRRRRPIPAAAGRARRAPQGDAGERFVTVSSTHSESVTS
jgi:RND family efflux transporter MFP subunit